MIEEESSLPYYIPNPLFYDYMKRRLKKNYENKILKFIVEKCFPPNDAIHSENQETKS